MGKKEKAPMSTVEAIAADNGTAQIDGEGKTGAPQLDNPPAFAAPEGFVLRKARKPGPRGPLAPEDRSYYTVTGIRKGDGGTTFLMKCKSRKRADRWITESFMLLQAMFNGVEIVRCKRVAMVRT
jgi:hypothetical protein